MSGHTLAIIGCGSMGTAIIRGILSTIGSDKSANIRIDKVVACTSQASTAEALKSRLANFGDRFQTTYQANVEVAQGADIVILAFKPYMAAKALKAPGMRKALQDKLVISILAGISVTSLQSYLQDGNDAESTARFIRVIPSLGATILESNTLIEMPPMEQAMADQDLQTVESMFACLGRSIIVSPANIEPATSVLTAAISATSVLIDGVIDGGVTEGLKRKESQAIAAQSLISLGKLLLSGTYSDCAALREAMSSPRGVTMRTILAVEKAAVRYAGAESVISGVQHLQIMSSTQQ